MRDFSKIYKEDLDTVGRKAVELGELTRLGVPIPDGFVITASFFKKFLKQTGISEKIKEIQKIYHPAIQDSMPKLFEPIKKKIMHTHLPQDLSFELHKFYKKLSGLFNESSLNIFTSPLKGKSIQFLNIKGDANLILKIKEVWASHINSPVAIVIQKNIASKTKRTTTTDNPISELEHIAKRIQKHFYFPKVLDYVIEKNKIYIIRIRPFTGKIEELPKPVVPNKKMQKVLVKGVSINPGIVTGPVKILGNNSYAQIKNGEIIILPYLSKSQFGKIKKAKAVITDEILLNSYDKMLYRKSIKIPTITGTLNATKILQNGNIVTVNGMSGEIYSGGLI